MNDSPVHGIRFNRAAFLSGTLATMSLTLAERAEAAAPASGTSAEPPQRLLGRLMAGNKRFVEGDFPDESKLSVKRELLKETQAPYAAILGCSDSRVIPNLVFVQGIGDLFVARVAGNYPDDLVTASIEYAVEHLGSTLIMVLGHQNCGAVKAVYSAIQTNTPLPPHLSAIENLMAPGIRSVVQARGTQQAATEANARAAVAQLRTSSTMIAGGVASGKILVVGAYYHLGSGQVTLLE
jgi:carbonic anhydrase